MTDQDRIQALRAAFPSKGLFRDKEWRLSPRAFALPADIVRQIEALGPALRAFQVVCNQLYLDSAAAPTGELGWVARLLDQGKPEWLIELGREAGWRDELPRVIRPDFVLTDTGLCLAEIDSLPGGMGLTAWLNATYAALGEPVIGGAIGMVEGFAAAYPEHDLLISSEAADYAPEMRWLLRQIEQRQLQHQQSQSGQPSPQPQRPSQVFHTADRSPEQALAEQKTQPGRVPSLYRFFELFDLANVEHADAWLAAARAGRVHLTPPIKPQLEEKLWLALWWTPQLADYWQAALSPEHHAALSAVIPQGWVVDPQPLPATAVYPGLDIHSWEEAKSFGQKARQLVLKISGYSELGWGSRGVFIGHDLSRDAWAQALDAALAAFPEHPYLLQRFQAGRVVAHPAWQENAQGQGLSVAMQARVRLCPYYFVPKGSAPQLSGVMATVCPADKKILHGMTDAMLLPCVEAAR